MVWKELTEPPSMGAVGRLLCEHRANRSKSIGKIKNSRTGSKSEKTETGHTRVTKERGSEMQVN